MKRYFSILCTCLFLFVSTSCERAFMEPEPAINPQALFDEAWTFADREYSFFDFKAIDWQAKYNEYQQQLKPKMTSEELFEVLADLLYELRDGHVNLRSSFDRSRNWRWFLDSPPNYDYDLLERNYFKEEQQFVGPFILYDFGDVGYIHYRSFSSTVSEGNMNYIVNKFKNHKGLIIDVRDNGGGSSGNVTKIASRFTNEPVIVGRERYRNGVEHDDFSTWTNIELEPYESDDDEVESDSLRFTKPVVVLTNRSSYSATTFFTQYMRELPNITTMGDWTGGGGGTPVFTELANGWILRVSNTQLESPDGFNVEDGIPPDIMVRLEETDRSEGVDTILERALAFLR